MAKSTLVVTKDDWTGEVIEPTEIAPKQITTFTFKGREYSLDLSMASADELRAALAPWMDKASEVNVVGRRTRPAKASTATAPGTGTEERTRIREWARQNGFDIGPRGRISDAILQAYQNRDDTPPAEAEDALEAEPLAAVADPEPRPAEDDSKPTAAERAAIREWALTQGLPVKARGPLSPDLIRDYRQAHAA